MSNVRSLDAITHPVLVMTITSQGESRYNPPFHEICVTTRVLSSRHGFNSR